MSIDRSAKSTKCGIKLLFFQPCSVITYKLFTLIQQQFTTNAEFNGHPLQFTEMGHYVHSQLKY